MATKVRGASRDSPDGGGVSVASMAGGVLAISISTAVAISLPIRDVDYNAVNLFTIVGAMLGGSLAIRGGRRLDGAGLGWGTALLFMAIVPAMFGWIGVLYLPSLMLLVAAAIGFITARN